MAIDRYDKIKELFHLIPRKKGWRRAEFVVMGSRDYRGKVRFVAGYGHSRMYASSSKGLVTDRIIGYGDTQDAAIEMMRGKLIAPQ